MNKNDILFVDVEATCWQPRSSQPKNQCSEIIEVGVTILNSNTLKIGPSVSMLVRPDYSQVSPFCTELTTITQEMLEGQGIPFSEACYRLRTEFNSPEQLWVSWGDYDREMFFKDSLRKGVEYPFGKRHLNLKIFFGLLHGSVKGPGVSKALHRLGLEFEGTQHRGVDDSFNTARIYVELIKKSKGRYK